MGEAKEHHNFGPTVKCTETGVASGVVLCNNAACEELSFGDTTTSSGGKIGCDGRGGVMGLLKKYIAELSEIRGVEA